MVTDALRIHPIQGPHWVFSMLKPPVDRPNVTTVEHRFKVHVHARDLNSQSTYKPLYKINSTKSNSVYQLLSNDIGILTRIAYENSVILIGM